MEWCTSSPAFSITMTTCFIPTFLPWMLPPGSSFGAHPSRVEISTFSPTVANGVVGYQRHEWRGLGYVQRGHLVGEPPLIRVALPGREAAILGMEGIAVQVVVDAAGVIVSATTDPNLSAELQSQAKAAALASHYRPFERNGHAVPARFEERVLVLPPELTPKRRVPFPTIRNWDLSTNNPDAYRLHGDVPGISSRSSWQ